MLRDYEMIFEYEPKHGIQKLNIVLKKLKFLILREKLMQNIASYIKVIPRNS